MYRSDRTSQSLGAPLYYHRFKFFHKSPSFGYRIFFDKLIYINKLYILLGVDSKADPANIDADDDVDEEVKSNSSDSDSDSSSEGSKKESERSGSDSDDSDDDDDDDDEELMRELEKIKRERAEEQERKRFEEEQELARKSAESMLRGNPLLNPGGESSYAIKRRWDDDVVFKNQSRKEDPEKKKRFINDTTRNDFHRSFLKKYIR
eukprot:TRINITY_DN2539_c0_g1_i2.p1 TRINITY_DN2539_c0_g1~~TRINITY_DN2539_c0_g1_i2.p1  ORF type:complete len:206 (+),score=64.84 TRINITY_DN2539_c0_g1_i2:325-942(+)